MSDITLKDIKSGFNLSKINDNFETIEDVINDEIIHSTGGNNIMSQDLDMNSKRLLNLSAPVGDTEPLRKGDIVKDATGATVQFVDDSISAESELAKTRTVIPFKTLTEAINSTDTKKMFDGAVLDIAERTTGSGGRGTWDVVLSSTVSENTFDIVQAIGIGTLSTVLRVGLIIDPASFGVTGNGTTLDAPAWSAMIDRIKTGSGGYVLGNPSAIYLLADATTTINSTLFNIDNIKSLTVNGNGATIKATTTLAQQTINIFKSKDGKNILFENFVIDTTLLAEIDNDPRGIQFFFGEDKCENITCRNMSGPGGVGGLMSFQRSNPGGFLEFADQARGITFENIEFDAVGFIGNFRHNGSYVTGRNIKVGTAHRVWFPYGVEEHDVEFEVDDFNAVGARLWGRDGRVLQNIKIRAKTAGVFVTLRTAASLVQLAFDPTLASTMRNIDIELVGEGNLKLGHGLEIDIEGAVTGKHTLDGLKINGTSNNMSNTGVHFVLNAGATLANDLIVENLEINDLKMKNNPNESLLPISNSTTDHFVRGLVTSGGNATFSLQGDATTFTKKVFFEKCRSAARLYAFSNIRTHFDNCDIGDKTNQNFPLSTYENTNITTIGIINKPDLRYVVTDKGDTSQEYSIGYQFLSGPTVALITLTLTKGTDIHPLHLPSAIVGAVAANMYSFCIGCVSGTDTGVFSGQVLLESDGVSDITTIVLADVSLTQIVGAGMAVGHLTVSLSSGSPVFTIDSGGPTIYNVAEIIIREM